jgi:hypothetical protein
MDGAQFRVQARDLRGEARDLVAASRQITCLPMALVC